MHLYLRSSLKVSWKTVILMVGIIALIEPKYFDTINWIDNIFIGLKVITALIVICLFFLQHQRRVSFIIFLIIAYEGILLVSTILFGGDFKDYFLGCAYLVIFSILTELMIEKDVECYIHTLSFILTAYSYINLLSFFLWPDGLYVNDFMWPCYFLGYRNVANSFLVPASGIIVLNSYIKNDRLTMSAVLGVFSGFLFNILTWSVTGIIAFSIFFLGLFFLEKTKLWGIIKLKYIIAGGLLVFYLLVIVRFQTLFSSFFVNVLHRNVTLTGRTELWDKLLILISQSFLLGKGVQGRESFVQMTGLRWANMAHNQFIQILVEGGMVALALFVTIMFIVGIQYDKKIKTNKYNVICLCISVFLIVFQAEVYTSFYLFFAVFIIAFHVDKIEISSKKGKHDEQNQGFTDRRRKLN